MSEQSNNWMLERYNRFLKNVINNSQAYSIGFGLFLYVMVFLLKQHYTIQNSFEYLAAEMLNVIGGALLSIGLVTIVYQKWKDEQDNILKQQEYEFREMVKTFYKEFQNCDFKGLKGQQEGVKDIVKDLQKKWNEEKNNKHFFIMGPSTMTNGDKLTQFANIDYNEGKILLIGNMSEGKIKEEYAFTTLLNGDNFKLLKKDVPVFSYGTTFTFLNKNKKPKYYEAFKKAIEKGMGLNVSIVYPEKMIADTKNIEDTIGDSKQTITDFKKLISLFIKEKTIPTSPIELRLSRYFSPCSFSSFEFNNGRTIRTLEFNFMHEENNGVKLSQVHDNPPGSEDKVHGKFSKYLYNRYNRLYKESFLALRYPMQDITYYVLGIITDIPNGSNKQSKFAVFNDNKLYKVVVHYDNTDINLKLLVKTNEGEYQDFSEEYYKIPELRNTIIGNVLGNYKKQTGCEMTPNISFEIDTDTFLLLGKIINTENLDKLSKKDFAKEEEKALIYAELDNIGCDQSIVNKIKAIMVMS